MENIEKLVIEYLAGLLSVDVYAEEPEDKPSSYVVIEQTGGGARNFIYTATIAVQCYADTRYEASALNEEIAGYMLVMADSENIGSCRLNGDYNFTNTATKKYRYQSVYTIVY